MIGRHLNVDRLMVWAIDYRAIWARPLIVLVVLAGSVVWAPRATPNQLLIVAGVAGLLLLLKWPILARAGLVVAVQTVPFSIGTGTETSINVAMLLVGFSAAVWFLQMIGNHEIRLMESLPIVPLQVFCVVAVLALLMGIQPWLPLAETASLPAQVGGFSIFILSALAFLLVAHQVPDLGWLSRITWLFLATAAVFLVARHLPGMSAVLDVYRWVANGSMLWTWLTAISFSQAVFNTRLPSSWRVALGILTSATFYYCFIENRDWTSGWAPSLVALLVVLWVGAPKLALRLSIFMGICLLLAAPYLYGLVMGGDNEYSAMTRAEAARILWEIIRINPVLGIGFANYYHYTPLFPILGYSVQFNSHNNYVDLLAQTGFVGFAAFGWVMVAIGRLAWRLRTRVEEGFAQAYVYGAIGGLVASLVAAALGDWLLPFVYNIGFNGFRASVLAWMFLGGLLVIERVALKQELRTAPGASRIRVGPDYGRMDARAYLFQPTER